MVRKSLGKKTRFEVFKRDRFTCAYCGKMPPAVVLEVDHVIPVSDGGTDEIVNLVASCFDCNRGKGAVRLTSLPPTIETEMERIQERRAQVMAFERMMRDERRRVEGNVNRIEQVLLKDHALTFTDSFRASVKMFLERLPMPTVRDAAEKAANRWQEPDTRVKYFCGICWHAIKGDAPSSNWSKYHARNRHARA